MVFKISSTDNDLYAKDYYNQEMAFQDKIDAKNNTRNLKSKFEIKLSGEAIEISFPDELSSKGVTGAIHLYRPDDASQDKFYQIKLNKGQHIILKDGLKSGKYVLKIECEAEEIPYFHEKIIQL